MALKPKFKIAAAAGAVALTVTTAVAIPSLAASGPAPVTSGSRYLALGDSIAFGFREFNAFDAPNPAKPSTAIGYPELVAADLGLKLTNAACPGETTSSFIVKGKRDNGCTKDALDNAANGYRSNFELHAKYGMSDLSQLQFAINFLKTYPNTKLVTIQLGANDGLRCRAEHSGVCTGQDLLDTVNRIQNNLRTSLNAITNNYKGQIVLVNYYSINEADPSGTGQVVALNQALAQVVNGTPGGKPGYPTVKIANAYRPFKIAAKNTPDGTTDTCKAGLETYLQGATSTTQPNGICGIHPSRAGQALLATAVDRVVAKS